MNSYYTVDVFKHQTDHPGSKQVSVHAALCHVSSSSSSLIYPWFWGEGTQGNMGTDHLGRDGVC